MRTATTSPGMYFPETGRNLATGLDGGDGGSRGGDGGYARAHTHTYIYIYIYYV